MTLYDPSARTPDRKDRGTSSFSLPLTLLHAVLAGVLMIVPGFGLYVLVLGREPGQAGEALAPLVLLAVVLALLWSAGTQLGNAPVSAVGGLGLLAVFGFMFTAPFLFGPRFSAAERATPFTLDDGRLCQPALDVVLPRPGRGIELQRELPEEFRALRTAGTHAWSYRDPGDGESVIFLVAKTGADSEESFAAFVRGFEGGVGEGQSVGRSLHWRDGVGDYRFGWTEPGGVARDVRCRTSGERGAARPLVVCVITAATDHRALAGVRRGLAFADCGAG